MTEEAKQRRRPARAPITMEEQCEVLDAQADRIAELEAEVERLKRLCFIAGFVGDKP